MLRQQQTQPTQYYSSPQFPPQPPTFSFEANGVNNLLYWNPQIFMDKLIIILFMQFHLKI
jgi:hypothetical protein